MIIQRTPLLPRIDAAERARGSRQLGIGPSVLGFLPLPGPGQGVKLVGISKDSADAVLPGATVMVFRTSDRQYIGETISDPVTGVFEYSVTPGVAYFVVSYKPGTPDVAGTTLNTLTGE